ncbi:hypothetical protein LPTSP2_37160 [Leptospira ellinghausenii]|uniref:Uncharacterized protein n=1 Tax=Leptospira ellinghausenii TaxID=1917822 RepID=A0A2P2DID4_9LEPT|nr:hypothetical protein [Leptospira ellinghausenii]GBF44413.1 hypothetical protein LPTSP2_37160 [Leptospira ellinghausenii]
MISNLPNSIPISKLKNFHFGDVDGIHDQLLDHAYVFCGTSPFIQISKARKRIIIGPKGSGKTAMFRLMRDKKIPIHCDSEELRTIGIQADLNLKSLKEFVLDRINLQSKKSSLLLKYRITWEIYLMIKIFEDLSKLHIQLPEKLKHFSEKLESIFSYKNNTNILDALLNMKKTIGTKFDTSQPTVHNVYASIERGTKPEDPKAANFLIVFDDILQSINSFLNENNIALDIMIDKLDDFVIKEEYEIQKNIFQALLEVESNYYQHSNIRLFLFIREDLFNRLNLDEYGSDKVFAKKINITWSLDDISQLIAKRISYNYFSAFNLSKIIVEFETKSLYIDKRQNEYIEESEENKNKNRFSRILSHLFSKEATNQVKRRTVSLSEEMSWDIIESLLPNKVFHLDQNSKAILIPLKEFIKTHLSCADNALNPRLVISFFNAVFEFILEYYEKNHDIKNIKKVDGKFPILDPKSFIEIYQKFKSDTFQIYLKQLGDWQYLIHTFHEKKGKRYSFLYKDLISLLEIDRKKEDDFKRFLAIVNHVGFLSCDNLNKTFEARKYTLPILFR